MCGIIGIISEKSFPSRLLLERLKRLEYRGYDSFGYYDGNETERFIGGIEDTSVALGETTSGIAHTRWATHGGVTLANTHPHASCGGKIIVAHNGIIDNYASLKKSLEKLGHEFSSETDSEVIAHFIEEKRKTKDMKSAMQAFMEDAQGTFAVLVMEKDDSAVYAMKQDSPLVLGKCDGKIILASDIYAFSDIGSQAIFFDNGELAEISGSTFQFYDAEGTPVEKRPVSIPRPLGHLEKAAYKHFMIKEIEEQPDSIARIAFSIEHEQKNSLSELLSLMRTANKIIFTACGTSYHAALLGAYFLHSKGFHAQALIASEFKNYASIDADTLVIALSQSGETMDVIESLNYSLKRQATVASIVNVPYSTIQRLSAVSINLAAGQEVAVASTKAYTSQVFLLSAIAEKLTGDSYNSEIGLKIKKLLESKEDIVRIAKRIASHKDCYIIGRGAGYPISREIALKIKEVSYIHAEGMMAGELKHGTLALISAGTPVISLISKDNHEMISSTKEVEARGAHVIAITNDPSIKWSESILVDAENETEFAILASIAGQLIAYYCADALGLPIDKPRNLAKSVTVK